MKKIHIVTYTHWDREFRWEFERTRIRLVECIDHLLEIMEKNNDYHSFLMDGQMTLIDDYLEIRPENRQRITNLIKARRLEIGPWYTLADCASIQGESIIRNLKYGMDYAKSFGNVLKCGYNVFSFGQIGQLPQIYADFGIDKIIFYKHLDEKRSKYHEFIWEAPDGTRALASKLGKEARWNFFFAAHIPIVYDKDAWHKDWQYHWGELGKVFHTADAKEYGWFYDILDPETKFHKENLRQGMERALETVRGSACEDSVLMFEGTDFTEPHPLTSDIIHALQEEYAGEYEIVHSSLSEYLEDLSQCLNNRENLDIVKGPLRDGPVGAIHTDVFTTHPEIMMENSYAENQILRYAEPLSVLAWLQDMMGYPKTYLDKIWKLMFQSHAHDSMHGLGPEFLGEGEVYRLKQAGTIAQGLTRMALQSITKEINTSALEDADYFIVVYNTMPFKRSEVVEAYIDIGNEHLIKQLTIVDEIGNIAPIQEMERTKGRAGVYHPRSRNMPFYSTKFHVYFYAEDVPAMGYKVYKVKWLKKQEYPYPHEDWDNPLIYADNLMTGARSAENEYISVEINSDGTVNIAQKETGKCYNGLNYFLDSADVGNLWMSDVPADNRLISGCRSGAKISMTINGPLVVRFQVEEQMFLPAEYGLEQMKALPIVVQYTLKKGARYLEVETTIHNTVKDHYLKVCFPTDMEIESTHAEGSFMVTKYTPKAGRVGDLRDNSLARHPAQLWFNAEDKDRGFAVLTNTAKDYEILEHHQQGTMAIGLLRATKLRIPCDNRLWMEYPGDESSQLLRKFDYQYALLPHASNWKEAGVHEQAFRFLAPMLCCEFGRQPGSLDTCKSFLEIENKNLIYSALKKCEDRDSAVLRIYNPTSDDIVSVIHIGFSFENAYILNMEEQRIEKIDSTGGVLNINAAHGKILTLEFTKWEDANA